MVENAKSKKEIGIVAIGYNRLESLKRLLCSLEIANYPVNHIPLIISLDYYEDNSVRSFVQEFQWTHGEKILCFSKTRMGLREHVLKCGNYVNDYNLDAVIVFEDDIMPARDFFSYATRAVEKFNGDDRIAGIALYSHRLNPNGLKVFQPAYSQYDNFLMQYACSWGQIWTRNQWNAFYQWYIEHLEDSFDSLNIPSNVRNWPDTSWLKYYIKYCIDKDKYFVYPYLALATNFSEKGTHAKETESIFQVPLLEGEKREYFFGSVDEAIKYDAFFERIGLGEKIGIPEEQLCVDLYNEQQQHRNRRYWLTMRKADFQIERQYDNSLKAIEENIIFGMVGNEINLYDTYIEKKNDWSGIDHLLRRVDISSKKKGLVLAGAGESGKRWLDRFQKENVDVLCFADQDENKIGRSIYGKKIISYSEMSKLGDKINIFITVLDKVMRKEIEDLLLKMGFGSQIIGNPLNKDTSISMQSHIYNSYLEGQNLLLDKAELVDSYLGRCSYLASDAKLIKTKIGKYSCIGPEVRIIIGQHPTSDIVSIHPAFYSRNHSIGYSYVQKDKFVETRKADMEYSVIIGNDVWIGMGAKIMEGVTIADGSIVAAGAVVVKDTEPFEVVGGVPAQHIKYRFERKERDELLEIQWWNKEAEWIKEHAEEYEDIKKFLKYCNS